MSFSYSWKQWEGQGCVYSTGYTDSACTRTIFRFLENHILPPLAECAHFRLKLKGHSLSHLFHKCTRAFSRSLATSKETYQISPIKFSCRIWAWGDRGGVKFTLWVMYELGLEAPYILKVKTSIFVRSEITHNEEFHS